MKKMMVILVSSAVAVAASADITSWNWTGGVVLPALAAGNIADGGLTFNNDLSLAPSFTGTEINIADIAGIIGSSTLAIGPSFAGGTYSTAAVNTDGTVVGDAWLVIDINGGGIQVGDVIGLGGTGVIIDLQPGGVGPVGTQQTFAVGDVSTTVTVIPEPATFGLMGLAGLGMFLARKKARR